MKKYQYSLLLVIILIASSILAYSAPINNYPVKLSQPDGSVINCFVSGDEYFNYYHTAEGYFIKKGSDGYYHYADQSGNEIITTEYIVNKANPNDLNIAKWLKPNMSDIDMQIQDKRANKSKYDNTQLLGKLKGQLNNIVIFIKFADDEEYTDSFHYYDSLLSDKNNISMRNYYLEASYNNLDVVSHIYPLTNTTIISYSDKYKREYYAPYDANTNPNGYKSYTQRSTRETDLIENAINFVLPQIPKDLNFDINNDGNVDNINFIVKGQPTDWSTLLWPHRNWYWGQLKINGLNVRDYNFNLSDLTYNPSYGLGTICHEFFHTLGAPDLYHYSYDGRVQVGVWDLMERNTEPPQFMSNFLKWQYTGWVDHIEEITKEGKYELNPTSNPKGSVFKIKTANSLTEYFILEYRQKVGWYDGMLPSSGLLVYRIDSSLAYQGNGNGAPDEIYLYRPNGTMDVEGNLVNANFCKEVFRTSIGEYTNPQLFLTNGKTAGLEIYNISECGETISFEVSFTPRTILLEPVNLSADIDLTPTFTWKNIPDAKTYDLELALDYDFDKLVVTKHNLSASNLKLNEGLLKGKKYFARVRWSNSSKTSPWSDVVEFSTIQAPTKLIYPINESNDISVKPAFKWNENINNNYYRIQVSENPDFTKIDFSKSLLKDTIIESTKILKFNTKYYWRIISRSLSGNDTESEIYSFTTKENEIVAGSFSESQDICIGDNITLFTEVHGTPANYKWFHNNMELEGQTDSTLTIENFAKENEGSYKCMAYNDELGLSYEFPEMTVNIINFDSFDYIPRITKESTEDNVVLRVKIGTDYAQLSKSFKFQWYKYDEKLSDNNLYSGTTTPRLIITDGANQNIDSMYKLQTISLCGDTTMSDYYSKIASVDDNLNLDNYLAIYPNPASGQFVVSFNSEGFSNTNLKIYNSYGQVVYIENDLISTNGINEISINADKLASGTYFIELYSGNTIKRQKFMVIR